MLKSIFLLKSLCRDRRLILSILYAKNIVRIKNIEHTIYLTHVVVFSM